MTLRSGLVLEFIQGKSEKIKEKKRKKKRANKAKGKIDKVVRPKDTPQNSEFIPSLPKQPQAPEPLSEHNLLLSPAPATLADHLDSLDRLSFRFPRSASLITKYKFNYCHHCSHTVSASSKHLYHLKLSGTMQPQDELFDNLLWCERC